MSAHCPQLTENIISETQQIVESACAYPASDYPLFAVGYHSLLDATLEAKTALEVCCGEGELVCELAAARPDVQFTAIDFRPYAMEKARARAKGLSNITFSQGDALVLSEYGDGSFDLIYGQATLHHLANNLSAVSSEYFRLLKPSGKLIFIFEPLGHSWLVAAIRAIRFSISQAPDESNLYFSTLENIGRPFSSMEIQCFNYLGYPLKAIGNKWLGKKVSMFIHGLDGFLCRIFPGLVKYGANFNVIFTK